MLLLPLLTATASAQPALAPDSVRVLAQRAAQSGVLTDSAATEIAQCAAGGIPVTRSAIVDAVVRQHVGEWSLLTELAAPTDPSGMADDPAAFVSSWVGRLAASGLFTPDDVRATAAPLAEVVAALSETGAPVPRPALMRVIAGALTWRLALNPTWLAEDAARWADEGMITDVGRARLLGDAQAGRLLTLNDLVLTSMGALQAPHAVLRYLDVTELTGVEPTRRGADAESLGTLATLMDAGVRLLRRRGVADLRVEGLAVDSVQRAPSGARPVLTAQVDGVEYRQRGGSARASVTLLNRVLRDRRSSYRLYTTSVTGPNRQRAEIAILVLTPASLALLQPREPADFAPSRRRVLEAFGQTDVDPACRSLALSTLVATYFELEVSGPPVTAYEEALSSEGAARALDQLAAAGMLDHLSAEQRAGVRDALSERYLTGPRDVLSAVPGLVTSFMSDDGAGEEGQPYADAIRQFAQVSNGVFRPASIVDTSSARADSARVGFTVDGRRFEATLAGGSWIDASFVGLIAAAVEDSGVRLYRLGRDTEDGFAFLTPEAWAVLATLGSLGDGAGAVVEVGSGG